MTTIEAKAPKTVAPWPTPRESRWRTTKAATVAYPIDASASALPGLTASRAISGGRPWCGIGRNGSGRRRATAAPASGAIPAKSQTEV